MSITWTNTRTGSNGHSVVESTEVTHEGLVVQAPWSVCERVMSDIWADVRYCRVFNPETGKAEVKCLGELFELNPRTGWATVDASPEVLAEVTRQDAAEAAAREAVEIARAEAAEIARAERERNRPLIGKTMKVVRGRKVPKGTEGIVFWMDSFREPTRVGLALDETRNPKGQYANVAWVDAAYLVAV